MASTAEAASGASPAAGLASLLITPWAMHNGKAGMKESTVAILSGLGPAQSTSWSDIVLVTSQRSEQSSELSVSQVGLEGETVEKALRGSWRTFESKPSFSRHVDEKYSVRIPIPGFRKLHIIMRLISIYNIVES